MTIKTSTFVDGEYLSVRHPEWFDQECTFIDEQMGIRPEHVGPSDDFLREIDLIEAALEDEEQQEQATILALDLLGTRALWPRPFPDHLQKTAQDEALERSLCRIAQRVQQQIDMWTYTARHSNVAEDIKYTRKKLLAVAKALGGGKQGKQFSNDRGREMSREYHRRRFRYRRALELLPIFPWPRKTRLAKIQAVAHCCGVPWGHFEDLLPEFDCDGKMVRACIRTAEERARIDIAMLYGLRTQTAVTNILSARRTGSSRRKRESP